MMYVLQTKPGQDDCAVRNQERLGYRAYAPRRIALHRRGGTWWEAEYPVFPGYVFLDDLELTDVDYHRIMPCVGVIRFLGHGAPEPLPEHEAEYIRWLHNGGKPIAPSEVRIRPDGSMQCVSGLISSYAGQVEHNPRHRRATIRISIAGKLHRITLAVRYIQQTDLMADAGVDTSPGAAQDCMMSAT